MSALLTVPGSEMDINTPSSAVKLDAGALNVRNRGTLAIAGAVEGLGEEAQQLSNDLSKVKMTTIAADADFRMRAAQHAFVKSTQGDPHDSDWEERAQQMSQQVKDDIYATHKVPPAMRPQLETSLRGWGQTLQIQAQTMSAVQSVHRAELAVETSFNEAGRDGSAEGMLNAVNMGKAAKLDPVKMQSLEQSIPRTLAETAINHGFSENPKATYDLLKSGGTLPIKDAQGNDIDPKKVFPPKEYEAMIVRARIETAKWQMSNQGELVESSAVDGVVPDRLIEEKIKSGEIGESWGRNRISSQDTKLKAATVTNDNHLLDLMRAKAADGDVPAEDRGTHTKELTFQSEQIKDPAKRQAAINAVQAKAAAFISKADDNQVAILSARIRDPNAWGVQPEVVAQEIISDGALITDEAKRKRVISEVNRQLISVKKTGNTAEKPVEKEIYAQMKADRAAAMFVPITQENVPGKTHWFSANEPAKFSAERIKGGLQALTDPKGAAGTKNPDYLSDDDIKKKFGENMTRDKLIAAERSFAANLEQKMALFFKGKPDASYDEANAFRMGMEKPYVMEQTKQAINTPISGQSSARPSNAAFYSKSTGKWYDKDKKEIP